MDILVADDEPYIARSLSFVLKKEGFSVDVASDGEEALRKSRESTPKVMFIDVVMPKMDGFQVCRTLKSDERLKDIYVFILTAKGQEADRERGMKEGADDYITKPFSPMEVVARVRKVFGMAR
jgi:two-component system alkaline phosphatase synthesis response regulator PhoP